jgi:hypothetical protein
LKLSRVRGGCRLPERGQRRLACAEDVIRQLKVRAVKHVEGFYNRLQLEALFEKKLSAQP